MGGLFSWLPSFKGAKGGDPPKKIQFSFYQKLPKYNIFEVKKHYHVLYAKNCIIIISARGEPPRTPTFEIGLIEILKFH